MDAAEKQNIDNTLWTDPRKGIPQIKLVNCKVGNEQGAGGMSQCCQDTFNSAAAAAAAREQHWALFLMAESNTWRKLQQNFELAAFLHCCLLYFVFFSTKSSNYLIMALCQRVMMMKTYWKWNVIKIKSDSLSMDRFA